MLALLGPSGSGKTTTLRLLAGFRQLDPSLEDAAASLGAGKLRVLRRVVLPLLSPALAAGACLAFVTAFGDFVTSIMLYTYDTRPISLSAAVFFLAGENRGTSG